ncbi:MAG TPA: hypothetical protein VFZ23_14720 [Pyrinomonadaceae bacterium]
MKRLFIPLTILLSALSVAGQSEHSVDASDLPGMVKRGLAVIARGPYRYTTAFEGHKNVVLEVDAKASIRVKSYNSRTGVTGECVIIGERMYHRSGTGPWNSQTKEEFQKAQAQLLPAIKDARARKDRAAHQRLLGLTLNNFAIFYALHRPLSTPIYSPTASGISDKTIAFIGQRLYKNKVARFYRWTGNHNNGAPASKDTVVRTEILYAFDQQTGALLMAETRRDWVYESKHRTHFEMDEWVPDPEITITAPVAEDLEP